MKLEKSKKPKNFVMTPCQEHDRLPFVKFSCHEKIYSEAVVYNTGYEKHWASSLLERSQSLGEKPYATTLC